MAAELSAIIANIVPLWRYNALIIALIGAITAAIAAILAANELL